MGCEGQNGMDLNVFCIPELEVDLSGKEVTRSHYVPKAEREKCQNESCDTSFLYPSLRRQHHCRRCGEIFCRECLQNKRRLNVMAQPDPLGVLCKVCPKCYEDRGIDLGCTKRSRTIEFLEIRQKSRSEIEDLRIELTVQSRRASVEPVCWKEQMKVDVLKECKRLLDGYRRSTENSNTINQIQHFRSHLKTPGWTKSTFWKLEHQTLLCRECGVHVDSRHQIKNCKVCGLAMCKTCAHKELLLYFEDDKIHDRSALPRLAIIKIKGSPEVEPRVSMLLHCCTACRTDISTRQTEDEEWYFEKTKPPDFETEFCELDTQLMKLSDTISDDLEKLSLEVFEKTDKLDEHVAADLDGQVQNSGITNLKDILDDELESYCQKFTSLKSLISNHGDHVHGSLLCLTKNYLQARSEFYLNTKQRLGQVLQRER